MTAEQRERLRAVLDGVATAVVEVDDDAAVDLATALHGSGPAYIYMVIESMIDGAVRLGMKRPDATSLVLATVIGSARYALDTGQHPAELRNAVTSPRAAPPPRRSRNSRRRGYAQPSTTPSRPPSNARESWESRLKR